MSVLAWFLFPAVASVAYHFVLYPAAVDLFARRQRHVRPPAPTEWPRVTLVIAAYNEEAVLGAKLDNSLELEYPGEALEIIVAADGSDDGTVAIAERYAARGVRVLHEPARNGKSAALNRAVVAARGEIIVFSDANNDFDRDAVAALVAHFSDPEVGGVCGRKSIRSADDRESSQGDGLYWRYESRLKKGESDLGIMTTADGEIFAVRRELYEPIAPEVINDDAEITFALVGRGKRIVYEPAAVSREQASRTLEEDYRVKVRMIAGGFQTVARHWRQLVPPTTRFAWAFLSHKLLRWLMPVPLLVVLVSSIALRNEPLGSIVLLAQVLFYGLAALGWAARARGPLPTWKYVPLYFSLMNVAAIIGLRRFVAGDGVTAIWQKAVR